MIRPQTDTFRDVGVYAAFPKKVILQCAARVYYTVHENGSRPFIPDREEMRIMLSLVPIVGPIFFLLKIAFAGLAFTPIVGPFFALLALIF